MENHLIMMTMVGHTGTFGFSGAGSNVTVFIRIHDQNGQKSEPIQLEHSLNHKTKVERNHFGKRDLTD